MTRHCRDRECVVYRQRAGRRAPARRIGNPGGQGWRRELTSGAKRETLGMEKWEGNATCTRVANDPEASRCQFQVKGTKRALSTRSFHMAGDIYKSFSSLQLSLSFSPYHGLNRLPSVHRRTRSPPHHLPRRTRTLRAIRCLYLSVLPKPMVSLSLLPVCGSITHLASPRPHLSFLVSSSSGYPCHCHVSPLCECSLNALCRLTPMTVPTPPSAV